MSAQNKKNSIALNLPNANLCGIDRLRQRSSEYLQIKTSRERKSHSEVSLIKYLARL